MKEKKEKLLEGFAEINYEGWRQTAEKSLRGKKVNELVYENIDSIKIEPIYTKDASSCLFATQDIYPGEFPFHRGSEVFSARSELLIAQKVIHFHPDEFNKSLSYGLSTGQNAICMKILSTASRKDEFISGTFISDLEDFERAFNDIDISSYPIYLECAVDSLHLLEIFRRYLDVKDIDASQVKIYICNDPISELLDRGSLNYDIKEFLRKLDKIFPIITQTGIKSLNINGFLYSKKGASPVQEIAFSIAQALDIIYYHLENGHTIDDIASHLHFTFSIGSDFFFEIAKFRALRFIWAKILHQLEASEKSQKIDFRVQTSSINKSTLDKETNILRSTSEAISAIITDCKSITITPYLMELEPDNDFAGRVAKNVLLVLQNECDLLKVQDPAGGSYYIESLTEEIIKSANSLLTEIDENGGFIESLTSGIISQKITATRNKRAGNIAHRKDVLIGVNQHPNPKDVIDDTSIIKYIESAEEYRSKMNKNLEMPDIQNNKIAIAPLDDFKPDKKIKKLRHNSKRYMIENQTAPLVFAVSLGSTTQHKARVDFIKDFLAVGGLELRYSGKNYLDIEDIVTDFTAEDYTSFAICGTDDLYNEMAVEIIKRIKLKKPDTISIIAGYPKELIEELEQSGIDFFININSDLITTLEELQKRMKIEVKR